MVSKCFDVLPASSSEALRSDIGGGRKSLSQTASFSLFLATEAELRSEMGGVLRSAPKLKARTYSVLGRVVLCEYSVMGRCMVPGRVVFVPGLCCVSGRMPASSPGIFGQPPALSAQFDGVDQLTPPAHWRGLGLFGVRSGSG